MSDNPRAERVPTFCALCVSRCGAVATVAGGELLGLEPDPTHPTGRALCVKGRVAPELVGHRERLLYPLQRTRPKGDADPGWRRIGWDEALALAAERLSRLARDHGPESVVFNCASPSTTAMSDSIDWVQRLRRAFGSPNFGVSMELCGWGRYLASGYTYGAPVPGGYMPDLENAGCILFWGYNPSVARLSHATATVAAQNRGARLIVVDPRRAGLARRADAWLRVRPGTDGALALALAHVLIERRGYDEDFVRRWTNAPLLVRSDDGRLLRARDLDPSGQASGYVAWSDAAGAAVVRDPCAEAHDASVADLALFGDVEVATVEGPVRCRPAFDHVTELCRRYDPRTAEEVTGVPASEIERAAEILQDARPVAFYAWSGVEQHGNVTQTVRAIGQLHALTGSLDARGGNVLFPAVPTPDVSGPELLPERQRAKALGLAERPLGPSRWEFVTSDEIYTAVLEARPYPVRGMVGFGANLLLAHADSARGRRALQELDFYLHADLFMSPTAEMADIVLPAASPFETEALRLGFEVSTEAQSLVQLRRPLVAPRGEARSDTRIVFDLAVALGLGSHFWDGDVDDAYRHQLGPSGLSLERLRAEPAGVRVSLETRYRKFADRVEGRARGLPTPTGLVELYSETLLEHGHAPVPVFEEPAVSPRSRPDLAARYPLVLTSAKSTWYCESQHRGLPSLRRRAPDPEVEMHPDAARARGIEEGDWVDIQTPDGSVRARAHFDAALDPGVVCGQHGWWQACAEIGAPAYDPFGPTGANLNLVLRHRPADPVSGSSPLRSWICEVARAGATPARRP